MEYKYELFDNQIHKINNIDTIFINSIYSTQPLFLDILFKIFNYLFDYIYIFLGTEISVFIFIPKYFEYINFYFIYLLFLLVVVYKLLINLYIYNYINKCLPSKRFHEIVNNDKNNFILVCFDNNNNITKPLGFLTYRHCDYYGFVNYFFIEPTYKNKGIGKHLLIHLYNNIKKMKNVNVNTMKVYGQTTTFSKHFWEKYGTLKPLKFIYWKIPNIFPFLKTYCVMFSLKNMERVFDKITE